MIIKIKSSAYQIKLKVLSYWNLNNDKILLQTKSGILKVLSYWNLNGI